MILADTSVWIDHFKQVDLNLQQILADRRMRCHAFVVGELMLGSLKHRAQILDMLTDIPKLVVAEPAEVEEMIEGHSIAGSGIGYVDAHLLTSTHLTLGCKLWTRDRRLAGVAERLGVRHQSLH